MEIVLLQRSVLKKNFKPKEGKQFQFCDCKSKNVRFRNVFAFYLVSKEKLKSFKFASHVLPPRSSFSSQEVTWQKLLIFKEGKNRQGSFSITRCFTFKEFQCKKLRSSLNIVKQRSIDCYNNINLHFILTFNYKLSSKCARIKSTFLLIGLTASSLIKLSRTTTKCHF